MFDARTPATFIQISHTTRSRKLTFRVKFIKNHKFHRPEYTMLNNLACRQREIISANGPTNNKFYCSLLLPDEILMSRIAAHCLYHKMRDLALALAICMQTHTFCAFCDAHPIPIVLFIWDFFIFEIESISFLCVFVPDTLCTSIRRVRVQSTYYYIAPCRDSFVHFISFQCSCNVAFLCPIRFSAPAIAQHYCNLAGSQKTAVGALFARHTILEGKWKMHETYTKT